MEAAGYWQGQEYQKEGENTKRDKKTPLPYAVPRTPCAVIALEAEVWGEGTYLPGKRKPPRITPRGLGGWAMEPST
jgi:hypothetical protein